MRDQYFEKVFPFLRWFLFIRENLRADIIAMVTGVLVLISQHMVYAKPAEMPAYFGLYAVFLAVMVGALWGTSTQLVT